MGRVSCTLMASAHTAASASTKPTRQPIIPNVFENVPITTTLRRQPGTDAALVCIPS